MRLATRCRSRRRFDDAKLAGKAADGSAGRGLLLGHASGVRALEGCAPRAGRLFGRGAATAHYVMVGSGTTGHAESVQITFDPARGVLRRHPARVLLGGARSDRARTARVRTRACATVRRFFTPTRASRRLRRPTSRNCSRRAFSQPIVTQLAPLTGFYAPRIITRTSWSATPAMATSCRTICRRSRTCSGLYPQMYRDQPVLVGKK
jgi:peptide-methionine (S)-S-oxide reductase